MTDTIIRAIIAVGGCLLLVWLFERFTDKFSSKRGEDKPSS